MKFESSNKIITGFNFISLATVLLLVFAIIFFSLIDFQKPVEEVNSKKNKVEIPKHIVDAKTPELQKSETKTEESPVSKEPKVDSNSIVKKVDKDNPNAEFELDFGGRAIRRIKSYLLPESDGTEKKQVVVKLNFIIKPDGSVAKIFPAAKTDTKFDLKSIYALRQWRFESLKKSADQEDQPAVITLLFH